MDTNIKIRLTSALARFSDIASVSVEDLIKRSKKQDYYLPRAVFAKAANERGYHPKDIGFVLGKRDRPTMIHSIKTFDNLWTYNREFHDKYKQIYDDIFNAIPIAKNSYIKVFLCGNVSHDWITTANIFIQWQMKFVTAGYSVYNPIRGTYNKDDFEKKIKDRLRGILNCDAVCYIHAFDKMELEAAVCAASGLKIITPKELEHETV